MGWEGGRGGETLGSGNGGEEEGVRDGVSQDASGKLEVALLLLFVLFMLDLT